MGPLALAARVIALGCLALALFGVAHGTARPRAGDSATVLVRQPSPRAACPDVMARTFAGLRVPPAAIRTLEDTAAHLTRAYDGEAATLVVDCNLVLDTITVTRVGSQVGAR